MALKVSDLGSFLQLLHFLFQNWKFQSCFPSKTSNVISILMRWRHNVIRNNLHLTLTVYLPLPAQQLFNGQKLSLRAFFVMNLKPFVLWGAWQLLLPCWNLMNPNHLKLDIISYGVALSWREIHHKNLWYGFLFTAGDLNLSEIIKRNRMKERWSSLMWGNNDYRKEEKWVRKGIQKNSILILFSF